MKIYVVVGNREVFGAYTNKEDAEKMRDTINRDDELGGGYGCVAYVKETELK